MDNDYPRYGLEDPFRRRKLDELTEGARAHFEKTQGERYWDQPRETTGPIDPWPGHSHLCDARLGRVFCTCKPGNLRVRQTESGGIL